MSLTNLSTTDVQFFELLLQITASFQLTDGLEIITTYSLFVKMGNKLDKALDSAKSRCRAQ